MGERRTSLYYITVSALIVAMKLIVKGKEQYITKNHQGWGKIPKDFVTNTHLLADL